MSPQYVPGMSLQKVYSIALTDNLFVVSSTTCYIHVQPVTTPHIYIILATCPFGFPPPPPPMHVQMPPYINCTNHVRVPWPY